MPTSTDVTNLKINELTEAQYDTAVQGGVIGANELSILTDAEAGQVIQVTTLPTASADELGNIYQFVGTTDSNYTNGYFYKCVSDGAVTPTYSWSRVDVQPQGGGSSYTAGTGIDITGGVISVTSPTLQNTATYPTKSLTILGNPTTTDDLNTNVGYNTTCNNSRLSVAVGAHCAVDGGSGSRVWNATAIGCDCLVTKDNGVAIGNLAKSYNTNAIAINGTASGDAAITINGTASGDYAIMIGKGTNSEARTFCVGWKKAGATTNDVFKVVDTDGTIPAARHAALPSTDGTYVLKLVIANGVPTLSWVAE